MNSDAPAVMAGGAAGSIRRLPRSPAAGAAVPAMFGYRTPPMPGAHRGLPSPYPAGGRWSGSAGGPGTSTAYLATDDVDGIATRVTEAGWRVLRPPAETDYGSREFAFLDPEGNAWSVGTYRGAGG